MPSANLERVNLKLYNHKMQETPKGTVLLNVCVIPPQQVGSDCVAISQSLQSPQPIFTLGGGKFAHMTMFMARFSVENIEAVKNEVEKIAKDQVSFFCQHVGYLLTEGSYLEVSYRRSKECFALHEKLIDALSPLRFSPGVPFEEGYFAPYTDEQQKNASETGYDLARQLFRPHITLTRYYKDNMPKLFPAFPAVDLSFDLSRLCVYRADDNGAVYELIGSIEI